MAVVVWVVYCGAWGYKPKYLQLRKKLEDFSDRLDICSEGTPQVTGFFEVFVAGKLIDSKKGGDGYVDTEGKFLKLVATIKAALAWCALKTETSDHGPAPLSRGFMTGKTEMSLGRLVLPWCSHGRRLEQDGHPGLRLCVCVPRSLMLLTGPAALPHPSSPCISLPPCLPSTLCCLGWSCTRLPFQGEAESRIRMSECQISPATATVHNSINGDEVNNNNNKLYNLIQIASFVAQLVKTLPATWDTWVWSLGWEDPLQKGKANHSSILAWRIPWSVQSMGSRRVRHDWAAFTFFILIQRDRTLSGVFNNKTHRAVKCTHFGLPWWSSG